MHEPVLLAEVVSHLAVRAGGVYVDATVGLGGHTAALIEAGAGRVIGLDRDDAALAFARKRLTTDRVELVHADYRDLRRVLRERGVGTVDGVLVDLGVSSLQLDDPVRGFSFRQEGPLDMRMDPTSGEPLSARLAAVDERTLADVIYRFGEERDSRRIARAIAEARRRSPISTTTELAAIVRRAARRRGRTRLDPATRTFQALRIQVNREIEGLGDALGAIAGCLALGGRMAVIAFHSLEDREVKLCFRRLAGEGFRLLTKKPVRPGEAEVSGNPRARSARLRAIERWRDEETAA